MHRDGTHPARERDIDCDCGHKEDPQTRLHRLTDHKFFTRRVILGATYLTQLKWNILAIMVDIKRRWTGPEIAALRIYYRRTISPFIHRLGIDRITIVRSVGEVSDQSLRWRTLH